MTQVEKFLQDIYKKIQSFAFTSGALNVNISSGSSGLPTGASTAALQTTLNALIPTIWTTGTSQFRSLTVNSTAQAVKASGGNLYGWNIINRDAVTIYVKIYNVAAASVNPASDVPIRTLQVAANGSVVELNTVPWNVNSTAIAVRAVTEATDTGTTAPATLPIIEILYS